MPRNARTPVRLGPGYADGLCTEIRQVAMAHANCGHFLYSTGSKGQTHSGEYDGDACPDPAMKAAQIQ